MVVVVEYNDVSSSLVAFGVNSRGRGGGGGEEKRGEVGLRPRQARLISLRRMGEL